MQLILSNADLISAVTTYLGSVLTVNETAQVQVELTEDGAIVVITPAGQEPQAPVAPATQTVKTRGKRTAKVTDGKLSTTEGPIVETPVVEKTGTVVVTADTSGQIAGGDNSPGATGKNPLPGDDEPEQEEEQEPVAEEPVAEKPVVNKATSLFANLNRPKN